MEDKTHSVHSTQLSDEGRKSGAHAGALTFAAFRAANVARCVKWHPEGIGSWSPSDWLTAVTGELGELASLLKMRNRERDGLPGNKFSPTQKQIADELADVLTYLDLLAEVLGVDLGCAAVSKFNEVSERVGFPDRIVIADAVAAPAPAVLHQPSHRGYPGAQA
jgi:NTP pyrophosphatase (non-canonical NTP hydrolase)